MVFCDKTLCRFRSDLRNSRNIIGGISHKPFKINKLLRRYFICFKHILCVIIFNSSLAALSLWYSDKHTVCSKLKKVSVSGKHCNSVAGSLTLNRHGSDYIVSLKPFLLDYGYAHSSEQFLNYRELFTKLGIHRFSRSFIGLIHLMSECRSMKIEGNSDRRWLFFIDDLKNNIQKAQHCICMKPLMISHLRKAVIASVHYAVSINQEQFLHLCHPLSLPLCYQISDPRYSLYATCFPLFPYKYPAV